MPLRVDQRRPTPTWLAHLNPAELDASRFPLNEALQHSLYYPAAGFDGRPVQFLGGFIHSFIYVDYGREEPDLDLEMETHGFRGYHVAGRKHLQATDLAPPDWRPEVPLEFRDQLTRFNRMDDLGFVRSPFAIWYVLDRNDGLDDNHGPQRFSLVYMCADGVATYQALYWQNKLAPEALAIIQPGTGFGGNYTDFRDPRGLFAWTVLRGNGSRIPDYLVCGGANLNYTEAFWPDDYPNHVEWFQHIHGNGVWGRGELGRSRKP